LVVASKNFAAVTKSSVDATKHFVTVTKYFCYTNSFANYCVDVTKSFVIGKADANSKMSFRRYK